MPGVIRDRVHRAVLIAAATLFLLAAAGCRGPGAAREPRLSAAQQALNVASFDQIWETIRDKHYDPDLGGVDWEGVRAELRPRVEAAQTMRAARAAMSSAIERLKLSHYGLIPHSVYERMQAHQDRDDGEIGLSLRVLDGVAVVTQVRAGSPAEQAGVRPGWVVSAVDGEAVAPLLESVARQYEGETGAQHALVAAVSRHIRGPAGQPIEIEFLDGDDQQVKLAVERAAPEGTRAVFGHLPPFWVRFESRLMDERIGYIAFNVFFDPATLMPQFEQTIRSFLEADAAGVILDLRGNPGGIGAMAMGMAGWFVEQEDVELGTMRTRSGELRFVIFPRARTFDGPVAVLVDGLTASTGEILAGGLQAVRGARVLGTPTAGAALPSVVERLPNGDGFQYALADYVSAAGRRLEGAGVEPDEVVELTRADLLAGRDPVLEAAVRWIESEAVRTAE